MADDLQIGDPVTLAWYEPGEPFRPRGTIADPTGEELARLDGERADRLLVHWRGPATPNHRRWERRPDLRPDVDVAEQQNGPHPPG